MNKMHALLENWYFGTVIMVLIFANAAFMALVADFDVKAAVLVADAGRVQNNSTVAIEHPKWYKMADTFFLIVFALELLLRILVEEMGFIFGENVGWNMFDTFLVGTAMADTFLTLSSMDLTFVRMLRILRALRTIRVIRVLRIFRELRLMLVSIMNSMLPIFWALIFLFLTMFVFAVVFLQGVTTCLQDRFQTSEPLTDEHYEVLQQYFGSFGMAVLSLFMAITGGQNWWILMEPFRHVSIFHFGIFGIYIALMMLGIMNVVIGVFCESTSQLSQMDREFCTQQELERTAAFVSEMREIFREFDVNKSGALTLEEFVDFTSKPEMQAYLKSLDLDVSRAAEVFTLLDVDGSHEIEIEEFAIGCLRLKGLAKSVDVEVIMRETKKIMQRNSRMGRRLEEKVNMIESQLTKHTQTWDQLSVEVQKLRSDVLFEQAFDHRNSPERLSK